MRILFAATILFFSVQVYSQVVTPDTSDYLPLYYDGALEYNLIIAASKGNSAEVERIILRGAEVNAETYEGATPLIFAVANNKEEAVKTLLYYDADVNKITGEYETPLFIAVKKKNIEIAETLIRNGADVNFQDNSGISPLIYASIYGYFYLVDMLLYYEADPDLKTNDGTTALMAAIWAGYADIADLLIQNGANMEARDNKGFTPFLIAGQNGDTLMLNLLRKKGVDIYEKNLYKWDALSLAIKTDQADAVEMLIKSGDKWNASGSETVNPYNVAVKYGRKEITGLLKKYNIPGEFRRRFDQMSLSLSYKLNPRDIYTGLRISFLEPMSKAGLIAGVDTKLWHTRVLLKESDDLFYQYMDRSSVIYAGCFKDFPLTSKLAGSNFSISLSVSGAYSFGNKLEGTEIIMDNKFKIIPAAGIKWSWQNLILFGEADYMNSGFYGISKIWGRAGCSFNFFFDNVRAPIKIIKWY